MAAKLNRSKPFDWVHGSDPLGRLYMQVQGGEPKYFDAQDNEVVEVAPEKRPVGRPPGKANAAKSTPEPSHAPSDHANVTDAEPSEEAPQGDLLDVDKQLEQQGAA